MQLRILGGMEVVRDDRIIEVPGARRRSLLATLALEPGHTVSVDKLIDAVWNDSPPATARNTVQVHIAALRKVFGIPNCLVNRGSGYRLQLPAPATDLVAAREVLARAADVDRPAERMPLLGEALAHWRGPALADVAPSRYLSWHATALDELHTTTREQLLADRLRLGLHRTVIAEVQLLSWEHPFRERPVRLLMTALYRDGRTSEALNAYGALCGRLREELGINPAQQTVSVWRRIVQGDPAFLVPLCARAS